MLLIEACLKFCFVRGIEKKADLRAEMVKTACEKCLGMT